jgi:hypothetical protein
MTGPRPFWLVAALALLGRPGLRIAPEPPGHTRRAGTDTSVTVGRARPARSAGPCTEHNADVRVRMGRR